MPTIPHALYAAPMLTFCAYLLCACLLRLFAGLSADMLATDLAEYLVRKAHVVTLPCCAMAHQPVAPSHSHGRLQVGEACVQGQANSSMQFVRRMRHVQHVPCEAW